MIRRRLRKERQEQSEQLQSKMANTSELTNNFCQSNYCNQMAGGKSPENGQNRIEERAEDLFQNNNHSSSSSSSSSNGSGGDDGGGGGGSTSSTNNNSSSNNNSTGNRVFWESFTSHQNPSSVFTKDSLSLETDTTTTLSQPSRHQTGSSSPCVTPEPSEPPIKRLKMSCEQFTSLQNVSIGDGVVSRRKLPKSGLRFHTRPSLLKNAHVANQNDIQCSITDILPDVS